MSIDTVQGEHANSGNYLSRKVLDGLDLEKLKNEYSIDTQPVSWDVGVPLLDSRPVIDRNHIDPTQIKKSRGKLTIFTDPGTKDLSIKISGLYQSAYDNTPIKIGPPLVGDEALGLCAPGAENGLFDGFDFSLKPDGTLTFMGTSHDSQESPAELFHGDNPNDATYSHLMNFAERMVTIPIGEGYRRPLLKPGQ